MEYLDVLDKIGKPTGQVKARSDVHRDGDWHQMVKIWIINSRGEVLLQKRAANKKTHPNMWSVSCEGHISAGHEPLVSAIRELEEELGLKVSVDQLKYFYTYPQERAYTLSNQKNYIEKEFKHVYALFLDLNPADLNLQREEVAGVTLVPFLELEKTINQRVAEDIIYDKSYPKLFELLHKKFDK